MDEDDDLFCNNCGWAGSPGEADADDLEEWMYDETPVGRCPECGDAVFE